MLEVATKWMANDSQASGNKRSGLNGNYQPCERDPHILFCKLLGLRTVGELKRPASAALSISVSCTAPDAVLTSDTFFMSVNVSNSWNSAVH